jgi:hypothetical protein
MASQYEFLYEVTRQCRLFNAQGTQLKIRLKPIAMLAILFPLHTFNPVWTLYLNTR